jgi:hypothetical protein
LSEDEKESVVKQLRGYFNDLRQIKDTFIGSVDETECDDQVFPDEVGGWGPYKDESEFNQGLIEVCMTRHSENAFICMLCRMLESVGQGHEIVVNAQRLRAPEHPCAEVGSGCNSGLGVSGFYPEYWEYCKVLWRSGWDVAWIKEGLVDRVLEPYPQEAAVILHTSFSMW